VAAAPGDREHVGVEVLLLVEFPVKSLPAPLKKAFALAVLPIYDMGTCWMGHWHMGFLLACCLSPVDVALLLVLGFNWRGSATAK